MLRKRCEQGTVTSPDTAIADDVEITLVVDHGRATRAEDLAPIVDEGGLHFRRLTVGLVRAKLAK